MDNSTKLNRAGRRAAERQAPRGRATAAALTASSAALASVALFVGPGAPPIGAATTLTVNSLANAGDGTCDVTCTLRDALDDAADGDTIVFDAALTGDIDLVTQLEINDSVNIQGPGAGAIQLDGQDTVRHFNIAIGGGAVVGNVTISGLTLKNGAANGGASIMLSNENFTLTNVDSHDNVSSGDGGAIYAPFSDSNIRIENSTFTNNEAAGGGALAMFGGGALTIIDSQFTDNHALTGNGGALYVEEITGPVTITGSTFDTNNADESGGAAQIYDIENTLTIESSSFTTNEAGAGGGGLYVYALDSVTISNSDISGNFALGDAGGGANIRNTANDVTITNSTINGNYSAYEGGGLAIADVYGNVSITDTTISGNMTAGGESSGYGGGGANIDGVDGNLTITNSVINDNTAVGYGGGLYLTEINGTTATISFTTIAGNHASGSGGGIEWYATDANLEILNSTISGNSTDENGGGLYLSSRNGGSVSIANSTISGNSAPGGYGGAIFFGNYYGLTITQSTITANTADNVGGVFIPDASQRAAAAQGGKRRDDAPTVRAAAQVPLVSVGSIISGNVNGDVAEGGTLQAKNSLLGVISGTTLVNQGGNLIGVLPGLGALANNGGPTQTHALLPGSPAIDAGEVPVAAFTGNQFDQRGSGYDRVVAGIVDIGAYEVQALPIAVVPTFTG